MSERGAGVRIESGPALSAVSRLLGECGLPVSDLEPSMMADFLALSDGSGILGVVGLQVGADGALLRSLAVTAERRGQGLGSSTPRAAEAQAAARGVDELWLLTESAEDFFAARGYVRRVRQDAPGCVRASREFTDLCAVDARLMSRRLAPD